jgi:N-acetyl-D-muramate 6-phosphate phosphatase
MSLDITRVEAVLFDLDGTLLDSAPDLGAAANHLRLVRGLEPLPQSAYRPYVGTGARGMLRIALNVEPTAPNFEALKEEFFQAYEACMGQHSVLFEGVAALIHALQGNGMKWGIVTNKSERFTLPIVAAEHVLSRALVVVCGDTTGHAKPHPEPLLEAARCLSVDADRCIYVGDDERDMVAARAASMQSVAAAYGYLGGVQDVELWRPDASIKSCAELAGLLGLH